MEKKDYKRDGAFLKIFVLLESACKGFCAFWYHFYFTASSKDSGVHALYLTQKRFFFLMYLEKDQQGSYLCGFRVEATMNRTRHTCS